MTGNPLITAQERGILCNPGPTGPLALQGAAPGGVFSATTSERRNIEGGQRLTDFTNTDFHEVIGVKGDFLDAWKYDAFAQVGITDQTQLNTNNFSVFKTRFGGKPRDECCPATSFAGPPAPANCVPYNPWVPGGVTAAQLNYLEIPSLQQGTAREYVVHADMTGDLGKYGVQITVGEERRAESILAPNIARRAPSYSRTKKT